VAQINKRNFTRGIFSPVVYSRKDVDAWQAGARQLQNVTIMKHGGVRKRPGTWLVYELPLGERVPRLFPFTYSPGQSYALLFGQGWTMPLALGGAVVSAGFGITAITNADPAVITAPYHDLAADDEIYLDGIDGMEELNGRVFQVVAVIDADNFSINVDSTDYGIFAADSGVVRTAAPDPPPAAPAVPAAEPAPTPPTTVPGGAGVRDWEWAFDYYGNFWF
jgi:hypothetical protein